MANLTVLIGGDDRDLQAALKRAQSSLRNMGKEFRAAAGTIATVGAAAATAAAAMAVHFTKEALAAVDAQAKLAQQNMTTVSSMATLERAGELSGVGMDKVAAGARALATRLGEAAAGAGPASEALKRINLSATDLAELPLDQRIATINERIREQIPLAEQAAVAAKLFGEDAGQAIRQLSPETIERAAEQARLFGHALSDIDAAKVEQANDAMSTISMAMDGFWKQIAIKVAPVLKKIGDEFERSADEAGGMEVAATRAFNSMIHAAGFVADSVDGIRRVAVITADGIVIAMAAAEAAMRRVLAVNLKVAQIGTLGLSDTVNTWREDNTRAMEEAEKVVGFAWENIQNTLMEPLPSEGFKRFVAEAQAAGEAAAAAVVAGRQGGREGAPEGTDPVDQAAARRLDKLREQFMTEDELLFERREKELEDIQKFEQQKLVTLEEAQRLREEVENAHWDRIGEAHQRAADKARAIEDAKNKALQQAQANFFANLSGLMNTQSKKVFEIGKVAAIAEALIKTKQAVVDAWQAGMSTGGPTAPLVAAGYAAAAALNGANLINNIRAQQFGAGGGTPTAPTQGASNVSPQGAGGGTTAGGAGGPTTIIHLEGDTFGREQVRDLLSRLNEERKDGGQFIFA